MERGYATAVMDALPERFPYRDEGCEVSASCLRCPLAQCKYDDPGWFQREKRKEKDREVVLALQENGLSVPEAASRFALSQRTVFRILRRTSEEMALTLQPAVI